MEFSGVLLRRTTIIGALLVFSILSCATPASAHVEKDVGAYHFVVGWGTEPAFAGQRIARKQIAEGDVFRICDHELMFTFR